MFMNTLTLQKYKKSCIIHTIFSFFFAYNYKRGVF